MSFLFLLVALNQSGVPPHTPVVNWEQLSCSWSRQNWAWDRWASTWTVGVVSAWDRLIQVFVGSVWEKCKNLKPQSYMYSHCLQTYVAWWTKPGGWDVHTHTPEMRDLRLRGWVICPAPQSVRIIPEFGPRSFGFNCYVHFYSRYLLHILYDFFLKICWKPRFFSVFLLLSELRYSYFF